ncbi:MAG: hypothetical protein EON90_11400 [Brevundimonas sp.]|nr:MAG: hypothetical protein EON90_11400 [Brevundimonas sp.]
MRRLVFALASLVVLGFAGTASAQVTIGRSPATAPVLGTTVRGSTTSVFSISSTGAVTRLSGTAIRLSSTAVTVPTISIYCNLSNCITRRMRVTIIPAGQSADAGIVNFRVSNLTGATWYTGAPADGSSITFDLNPIGLLGTATFKLGMDVQLAAGSALGVETFNYTVTAQLL